MDLLPSLDIQCPCCGEYQSITVDVSAGDQVYIEDCQICCRPMSIVADVDEDGVASVRVHAADEGLTTGAATAESVPGLPYAARQHCRAKEPPCKPLPAALAACSSPWLSSR